MSLIQKYFKDIWNGLLFKPTGYSENKYLSFSSAFFACYWLTGIVLAFFSKDILSNFVISLTLSSLNLGNWYMSYKYTKSANSYSKSMGAIRQTYIIACKDLERYVDALREHAVTSDPFEQAMAEKYLDKIKTDLNLRTKDDD